MNNVEFYNAHCRIYQAIKQCLETKLKYCDDIRPGFTRHVLNLVESYQLPLEYFDYDGTIYDDNHYLQNLIPFCDGNRLSNYFSQQFDRSLLNCLTNETLVKHRQCLNTFKNHVHVILRTKASLDEITKWSEDFLRCVYNSIPRNCPTPTKEVFVFKESLVVRSKHDRSKPLNITKIIKQKLPSQVVQTFAKSRRATSSIHGDPHLVQLHTTKPITCKLLNNRTYISNSYFKITGVSKHVGHPSLTATAITSLQIDFFNSSGSLIAYYRAFNGKLPLKLIYLDSSSLSIIKIDHGNKHATEGYLTLIHIPTSTQIIVNRWSRFHFFLIRSSELLLNNSHGYLITGCPKNEIIDRQAIIARLKARFAKSQRQIRVVEQRQHHLQKVLYESELPEQCEQICSSRENDFFDECMFDCLALASVNATLALHVNEMHVATSRERRHIIENDHHVLHEFTQCYKKGSICQIIEDPDLLYNKGIQKQIWLLTIIMMIWCIFYY